jgi:hypothetical protein
MIQIAIDSIQNLPLSRLEDEEGTDFVATWNGYASATDQRLFHRHYGSGCDYPPSCLCYYHRLFARTVTAAI